MLFNELKCTIDGPLLLSLKQEDFLLMGIPKDVIAKMHNVLGTSTGLKHNSDVLKKRFQLRKKYFVFKATKILQRSVRRYLSYCKGNDWLYITRNC